MPNTLENLKTAFAGESQANRKYLAFSKKAEKDGFPNLAKMFKVIAEAETVHAHNHLRTMGGVKSTLENLEEAKGGEFYEITKMYPDMVETAKKEDNKQAERTMNFALQTEKIHEKMYEKAINKIKDGKDIDEKVFHFCPVCGCTFEGEDLPDKCPICSAKKELFIKI
ncbi:MAG: rubrerythrin family protein [Candidatus Helarchaeota archaeon]|nr:rubrerythrin family protein [Candidatus Helarchaeota archaeon]